MRPSYEVLEALTLRVIAIYGCMIRASHRAARLEAKHGAGTYIVRPILQVAA